MRSRRASASWLDDLLATGGTMAASISLLRKVGADVRAAACIIELSFLADRQALDVPIVERTFAWISRNRRLGRDFERHVRSMVAFIRLAMIRIILRWIVATPST